MVSRQSTMNSYARCGPLRASEVASRSPTESSSAGTGAASHLSLGSGGRRPGGDGKNGTLPTIFRGLLPWPEPRDRPGDRRRVDALPLRLAAAPSNKPEAPARQCSCRGPAPPSRRSITRITATIAGHQASCATVGLTRAKGDVTTKAIATAAPIQVRSRIHSLETRLGTRRRSSRAADRRRR
jgi:hypothetical protein